MKLGDKVRFVPHFDRNECGVPVTARVVYIHRSHSYFTAEWMENGNTFRESFKMSQIGQAVQVYE